MNRVQQYVNQHLSFGYQAPLTYRFLNEFGKVLTPTPFRVTGTPKECFRNSFQGMSLDMHYCEGFAMTSRVDFPVLHAWLVNERGEACDPTWDCGIEYFGVQFDEEFVYDYANRTGYYGIFESLFALKMNPEECFQFLKGGLKCQT